MKILIGGDLVITDNYSIDHVEEELLNYFQSADYSIINLEAPVTDSISKIIKTGPHLKAHEICTRNFLKKLDIDLITLANNHIKDYDIEGVLETINFCNINGFKTVGAGKNLEDAAKILYVDAPEAKIAFINIAENEWASAAEDTAGANGMNLIRDVKKINEAKKNSDYVFVIVHGGHEYYTLPSPRIQEQYRFYAEQGADIVVSHHTHCISGYEKYKGVPIYYSLGNFLFTKKSPYDDWYTGLVLEVEIKNRTLIPTLIPVKQAKETFRLSLVKGEERKKVMQKIESLNSIINDEIKLAEEWKKYIQLKTKMYLGYWSPLTLIKNKYIKAVLNRLKLNLINKNGLALYLNLIRCESHVDMCKGVLMKNLNGSEVTLSPDNKK